MKKLSTLVLLAISSVLAFAQGPKFVPPAYMLASTTDGVTASWVSGGSGSGPGYVPQNAMLAVCVVNPALPATVSNIGWCTFSGGGGSGTVTSVALSAPSWLTVTGSPVTTSGTLALAPTTAQTSHEVIGTCGTATTFGPCALVAGDIPTGIPIANVGSAGLSASGGVTIASSGAIACTAAASGTPGCSSPDNTTITASAGVLTALGATEGVTTVVYSQSPYTYTTSAHTTAVLLFGRGGAAGGGGGGAGGGGSTTAGAAGGSGGGAGPGSASYLKLVTVSPSTAYTVTIGAGGTGGTGGTAAAANAAGSTGNAGTGATGGGNTTFDVLATFYGAGVPNEGAPGQIATVGAAQGAITGSSLNVAVGGSGAGGLGATSSSTASAGGATGTSPGVPSIGGFRVASASGGSAGTGNGSGGGGGGGAGNSAADGSCTGTPGTGAAGGAASAQGGTGSNATTTQQSNGCGGLGGGGGAGGGFLASTGTQGGPGGNGQAGSNGQLVIIPLN